MLVSAGLVLVITTRLRSWEQEERKRAKQEHETKMNMRDI